MVDLSVPGPCIMWLSRDQSCGCCRMTFIHFIYFAPLSTYFPSYSPFFFFINPINWVASLLYAGPGKFIPPCLITFTACKILYYWNSTDHSVRSLPVISFPPCRWVDQLCSKILLEWDSTDYSARLPPVDCLLFLEALELRGLKIDGTGKFVRRRRGKILLQWDNTDYSARLPPVDGPLFLEALELRGLKIDGAGKFVRRRRGKFSTL